MRAGMEATTVREGYELWRPNREKTESVTTKFVIVLLLVATSAIACLVAITGYGRSDDSLRSYEAGYDEHLVKPVNPRLLSRLLAGDPRPPDADGAPLR